MRRLLILALALLAAACAAADRPASPERLGRFMGLVAQCGCSDVSAARLAQSHPDMRGFIELGASENFSNQVPICREACSQTCAVNAVVLPLGGRPAGDGRTCPLTEGGINLTTGWSDME